MDFEYTYTAEQERFRKEVQAWIKDNVPENMKLPLEVEDFSPEMYKFWREKHKEMAPMGWLFPTLPKQYGGGGMSPDMAAILNEELDKNRIPGTFTMDFVTPSLLVWATEEQKQKFLAPILTGEKIAWQKFTEPKSGSDLASYQSKAVRDGDDWILTGSNVFVSGGYAPAPDYLYGPMMSDPEAPRHRNLGYFMIPCPSPGLDLKRMKLVSGSDQWFVYLDGVRVPGDHLIGGDHQGWQVTMTGSEKEHGGEGSIFRSQQPVSLMVNYMKAKKHQGQSPGGDPVIQQVAVDAYVGERVAEVVNKRTIWMYHAKQEMTWEGPTVQLFSRVLGLRNAARIRDECFQFAPDPGSAFTPG